MSTDVLPESKALPRDTALPGPPPGRRAFFRSCAIGGGLAAIPFVTLLLMNGANFQSDSFTTRFYASQARSFLRGEWSMPHAILAFEGFQHGSKWYMYYGPFPALLRIPFVHLIPGVAERMTQSMILVATTLALVCTARILWHVRRLVRPDRPVSRQECWWAGVFLFVMGAGSAFTFLSSQAWVYHEAEAWGAALAIASFDALLVWLRRPSRWPLVLASAFAWASVLSRASVGFGPIAALGLLTIAVAWPRVRAVAGVGVDAGVDIPRGRSLGLAAATAIPIVSYCYVNFAKFGNLFVFPTAAQEMSQINPGRQYFLSHSGGSYFALKFIPSTLLQYLRPDALRFSSLLPFIDFPHAPHVIGGVVFDAAEPTSSLPSSMPFLSVLACVAIFAVFRRRQGNGAADGTATMRIPLAGAVVGALSVLPFGYIAQRYLSDFLPLLVLAGAAGLHVLLRWREDRSTAVAVGGHGSTRSGWARFVFPALGVLVVISVLVNVALAVSYHYTSDWAPQEVSGPFVAAQYRLHDVIPGGAAPHVERGARLPTTPGARGTVFVVGNCDGVYWSPGPVRELAWGPWQGVARSAAAGEYHMKISFRPTGNRRVVEPILVRGAHGQAQMIAAFVGPGPVVNFAFSSQGHADLPRGETTNGFFVGQREHIQWGKVYGLKVVMDPNDGHVAAMFHGDIAFRFVQFELTPQQSGAYVFRTNTLTIGRNPYDHTTLPAFLGTLDSQPVGRPSLCNDLGVH